MTTEESHGQETPEDMDTSDRDSESASESDAEDDKATSSGSQQSEDVELSDNDIGNEGQIRNLVSTRTGSEADAEASGDDADEQQDHSPIDLEYFEAFLGQMANMGTKEVTRPVPVCGDGC